MDDKAESEALLRWKVQQGLFEYDLLEKPGYRDRMEFELSVIVKMGFVPYFLIVGDLCGFMREKKIRFLVRGSGCGSLCVYALKISHRWLDPIVLELPFERFLNPSRVTNPDLDIDIQDDRRHEVVAYTVEKYGKDRVARIATFGTLGAKAAIQDIARAQALPNYQDIAKSITSLISSKPGTELETELKNSDLLREKQRQYPELFATALKVEGKARNVGVHAAGTVITPEHFNNYIPVFYKGSPEDRDEDGKTGTAQFDMYDVEEIGLLKMDYLGLKTLRVIEDTVRLVNIQQRHAGRPDLDVDNVDRFDKTTWDLLARGQLSGVFQVEKQFVRGYAKRMNLAKIDPWQLAVMVAIIRPGMMDTGNTERYLRRASGQETPTPLHPLLAETFKKTYGIMCFHGDTRVAMADGSEKPIRDVRVGDRVVACRWPEKHAQIRDVLWQGATRRQDGVRITLENGFALTVTPDHKIYGWGGKVEAGSLRVGDLVATGHHLPTDSHKSEGLAPWLGTDQNVAYFLGQVCGDGSMLSSGCRLCAGSLANRKKLEQWLAKHLPGLRVTPLFSTRAWYLQISSPELAGLPAPFNRTTKLSVLLQEAGLRCGASHKRIPHRIMTAPASVQAAFMAGLIDSDGSLCRMSRGSGTANISSVSVELREDVRALCAQFGIPTSIYAKAAKVFMWDTLALSRLVRPYLVLRDFKGTLTSGGRRGRVPKGNKTTFSMHAKRYGHDLGSLRFYRVKAVEPVRDQQFYCINVQEHHNLFANGILAENCFQEDVMWCARDLAGFSLAEADVLRKGVGKKKPEFIAKQQPIFFEGGMQPRIKAVFETPTGRHEFITKPRNPDLRAVATQAGVEIRPDGVAVPLVKDGAAVEAKPGFRLVSCEIVAPGATREECQKIWEEIEAHARYSFNNAHAAAYGLVGSYQTAYLKAHHTLMYMCSMINSEAGGSHKDLGYNYKVAEYVEESRILGLRVSKPCLKRSIGICAPRPTTNEIVFGLSLIKGVSISGCDWIVQRCRRAANMAELVLGCFEVCPTGRKVMKSKTVNGEVQIVPTEFDEYKPYSRAGKSDLEALVWSGALDVFAGGDPSERPRLAAMVEPLIKLAGDYYATIAKIRGGATPKITPEQRLDAVRAFHVDESSIEHRSMEAILEMERALTGCFLSMSPFEPFRDDQLRYETVSVPDFVEGGYEEANMIAVLRDFKELVVKRGRSMGRNMARLTLTGVGGEIEAAVFTDEWESLMEMQKRGAIKPVERHRVFLVRVRADGGRGHSVHELRRLSA